MKLGMNKDNIDYQLTDTKPENIILDKEIIDTKETKQTDIFKNVDEEELNNFNIGYIFYMCFPILIKRCIFGRGMENKQF